MKAHILKINIGAQDPYANYNVEDCHAMIADLEHAAEHGRIPHMREVARQGIDKFKRRIEQLQGSPVPVAVAMAITPSPPPAGSQLGIFAK